MPGTGEAARTWSDEDDMKNPMQSLEDSVFTTKYHEFVAWARKNSLWPYPFGTACCGIEYMPSSVPSTTSPASAPRPSGSRRARPI